MLESAMAKQDKKRQKIVEKRANELVMEAIEKRDASIAVTKRSKTQLAAIELTGDSDAEGAQEGEAP